MATSAWLLIAATWVLAVLLTSLARWLAPRVGMLDQPDQHRKQHRQATPLLGGVAIFVTLAVMTGVTYCVGLDISPGGSPSLLAILLFSASLFCFLGLIDDFRPLKARHKLFGQIVASLPFAMLGPSISSLSLLGWQWEIGYLGIPFAIFWLVACANVINLTDGLDGLAGSISLIATISLGIIAWWSGSHALATLDFLLAASVGGFLVWNWPPAKIFMGDAGSLTLGFLIGALAVNGPAIAASTMTLALPLVLISIPIFDTAMAVLRRKLSGRGIGHADRGHLHHRLQQRGLSRGKALLAIVTMCIAMAVAAVSSVHFNNEWLAIGACAALLALLVITRVFGGYETDMLFLHVRAFSGLWADTCLAIRSRVLLAQLEGSEQPDWERCWEQVCHRVEAMGGLRLDYCCTRPGASTIVSQRNWPAEQKIVNGAGGWHFSVRVPRDKGVWVTVNASGDTATGGGAQIDELYRLFEGFCASWPIDEKPKSIVARPDFELNHSQREDSEPRILSMPSFSTAPAIDHAGNRRAA